MYFKFGSINEATDNSMIVNEHLENSVDGLDNFAEDANSLQESGILDQNALLESVFVDQVTKMDDEQRKAYLESDEVAALVEAGVVGRRTIVRISKNDDLTRRIHLASLQKAKESGDADWEALRKNRVMEKKLLQKIYNKYANRVRQDAVKSQKRLIKLSPKAFDMSKPIR